MSFGIAGIASGADWGTIIDQFVTIESRTLNRLRANEQVIEQQISDYGKAKNAITNFQNSVDGLRDELDLAAFSGSSTDEDVLTVETGANTAAASYAVIVSNLATHDKLASSAYTDTATAVGNGSIAITVDGNTSNITVDGSNNTLAGLRDAINTASDNPGVTATILNETGGSRLILTSDETGAANAVSVSVVDTDDGINTDASGLSKVFHIGVGGDGLAEQVSTAVDALVSIDGFSVQSASNTISDAVTGVEFKLVAAGTATADIERDNSAAEERVTKFVAAYNELRANFDVLEASSPGNKAGLSQIEQGFSSLFGTPATVDGSDAYLFEIGITRDKTGHLNIDTGELSDAFAADFDRVALMLGDDTTGFATRFYDFADQVLKEIVPSREDGLNSRKRLVETQIERQEIHVEVYEKTLVERFAALDMTVSGLQGTSNYLAALLNNG